MQNIDLFVHGVCSKGGSKTKKHFRGRPRPSIRPRSVASRAVLTDVGRIEDGPLCASCFIISAILYGDNRLPTIRNQVIITDTSVV